MLQKWPKPHDPCAKCKSIVFGKPAHTFCTHILYAPRKLDSMENSIPKSQTDCIDFYK